MSSASSFIWQDASSHGWQDRQKALLLMVEREALEPSTPVAPSAHGVSSFIVTTQVQWTTPVLPRVSVWPLLPRPLPRLALVVLVSTSSVRAQSFGRTRTTKVL